VEKGIFCLIHIAQPIMTFLSDFEDGFSKPFKYAYSKFEKVDQASDKVLNAGGNLVDGLGNLLQGNTLFYIGIGVVAVIVLPKLLDKVL
jgi:hypothetical protein